MAIAFVTIVCASVVAAFIAYIFAMRQRICPNCHEVIEPDPRLVRMFESQ